MRVLLTLHHHLDPNLGAPGATLALGAALEGAGCVVDYYGFERAFPGEDGGAGWGVRHSLQFPVRLARFLHEHARDYDVIDASTGDAWLWAARRRPFRDGGGRRRPALFTRTYGLEHIVDERLRAEVRGGRARLSWKYPLYHGGYRLWEVAQSLRRADACVLANEDDLRYVRDVLGVPAARLQFIPIGVSEDLVRPDPLPAPATPDEPLRLAFVASWIERKGTQAVVAATRQLAQEGVEFSLSLFGTGKGTNEVLSDFPAQVRPKLTVVPRYVRPDLPGLLAGQEVLLFPSLHEGFSLAMLEAMACGLTPVATPVGGAPVLVRDGANGILIPAGEETAPALAAAVRELARDRWRVAALRAAARDRAREFTWGHVAQQTMVYYDSVLRGAAAETATVEGGDACPPVSPAKSPTGGGAA